MKPRLVCVVLVAGLCGACAVPPDAPEPRTDLTLAAQRFGACVGPSGARQDLPTLDELPVALAGQRGIVLSVPGLVSDGYFHWLLIDHRQGQAYIVQQGGIAGTRRVFGPFSTSRGCAV